jgi:hypothetical protein
VTPWRGAHWYATLRGKMGNWHDYRKSLVAAVAVVTVAALALASALTRAQGRTDGIPRLPNGHVGIWQANNTANWDLLTHQARQGPLAALGAAFSVPGGLGVVEGK